MSLHGPRFESGGARVRICAAGFALSFGRPLAIVDRRGAQDIVRALTYALLATVPAEPPPTKRKRSLSPRPAKRGEG